MRRRDAAVAPPASRPPGLRRSVRAGRRGRGHLRIAVCRSQVPFVHGGVEIFTDALVRELRARGHEAEIVAVPFQSWPNERLLIDAIVWRMLELAEASASGAELVIATKFPSYMIRHPRKVTWLVHQFRQAYELHGTAYGQLGESAEDRSIRRRIQSLDREALGQSRLLFATSGNVARRLRQSTGLAAEVLRHPPQGLGFHCSAYEPFILSVGRLDAIKRVELLIAAARAQPALRVVVAGEGPDRSRLERLAEAAGPRVRFTGRVSQAELVDLYARCRAVFYAPYDEDYGMVPFEAFRCAKPVLTTSDAGGPLEVVVDGVTGIVVEPSAEALAAGALRLLEDERLARGLGEAGLAEATAVGWDEAIGRLLA
jgi:glycosyltransferase involved in cell wall biosynthesis